MGNESSRSAKGSAVRASARACGCSCGSGAGAPGLRRCIVAISGHQRSQALATRPGSSSVGYKRWPMPCLPASTPGSGCNSCPCPLAHIDTPHKPDEIPAPLHGVSKPSASPVFLPHAGRPGGRGCAILLVDHVAAAADAARLGPPPQRRVQGGPRRVPCRRRLGPAGKYWVLRSNFYISLPAKLSLE